jgi:hypothetical protein
MRRATGSQRAQRGDVEAVGRPGRWCGRMRSVPSGAGCIGRRPRRRASGPSRIRGAARKARPGPRPPPAPASRRSRPAVRPASPARGGVQQPACTAASLRCRGPCRPEHVGVAAEGAGGRAGGVQQHGVELRRSLQAAASAVTTSAESPGGRGSREPASGAAASGPRAVTAAPAAASCRVLPPGGGAEVEGGLASWMCSSRAGRRPRRPCTHHRPLDEPRQVETSPRRSVRRVPPGRISASRAAARSRASAGSFRERSVAGSSLIWPAIARASAAPKAACQRARARGAPGGPDRRG